MTFVDETYAINDRSDFDDHLVTGASDWRRFVPGLPRTLRFIRFLRNCDVLVTNFDGGLLRHSPLRFLEHWLLKAGNKKLVLWPYGADSFVYTSIADHTFRYGLYQSYPAGARREQAVRRQIAHFNRHADFIVANIPHHEALPRWDVLTVACYGVDIEEWKPLPDFGHVGNGDSGKAPVRLLHCPNHCDVKGTQFIIDAVAELRAAGVNVELTILEGVKNHEILAEMQQCDIVVAQLLYGYASTEIEGMSLGKPVISNLDSPIYYPTARRYTYFHECPLVSATPETLGAALLELVKSPGERTRLGQRGREYVRKFHSLEGQGRFWSTVVRNTFHPDATPVSQWWLDER